MRTWGSLSQITLLFISISASALPAHRPPRMAASKDLGHVDPGMSVHVLIPLAVHNADQLANLITRQHIPGDALYGEFLTPSEFSATFGPTPDDAAAVAQYLSLNGFTNIVADPSNAYVLAEAEVPQVEHALSLELHNYQTPEGLMAYGPTNEPTVPPEIASRIQGIYGLHSFSQHRHHALRANAGIGSGPQGGLTPADFRTAYGLDKVTATGKGQKLALFELDGYALSDITAYATQFNLRAILSPMNILVDGFSGKPTKGTASGQPEVTLDIELALAVAPAVQVLVYEAPNTEAGYLQEWMKIASDNLAKAVSTSWGAAEDLNSAADLATENMIFMQMAAQGQSVFAAAGDDGAYDDPNMMKTLEVDDPGSQPYVTSVGGTTLAVNAGLSYKNETVWSDAASVSGGGGGISSVWPIPSWQTGLGTALNLGSTTQRMVPDISLNSDPNTGYSVFVQGASDVYGGTSCAAPIWTAFTALVNQQREATNLPDVGYVNPTIYRVGQSSLAPSVFHDVTAGKNLFYPAETNYDLATGLGSFNAMTLFQALINAVLPPAAPTQLKGQRVVN